MSEAIMQSIPAVSFAVGCFVGAWLTYRGRKAESPLPTLPKKVAPVDDDEKQFSFTRVKP
jgi:hypothetical protein